MDRMNVYMGDHTVLTKLAHGPKIFLDTRELSMASHLILDGLWEDWITKLFVSIVKPGMTVLDIGGNCGYYSLLASHLVGNDGTVHAFEPNPFHHSNFIKSKSINGFYHLHLHKVALADKQGTMPFHIPVLSTASASFYKEVSEGLIAKADIESIDEIKILDVSAVKLTDYLPNLKADVIKMDIEGAEPLVMESIFEIINNSGKVQIIMEYKQGSWMDHGFDCQSILDRFISNGFTIQIIQHDSTLLPVTVKELIHKSIHAEYDLYISNSET
ncbi:FkbM family methyltransferase [Bacillus sp. REN3]|uniref:FkbM family methyltransferase n=1 Tax=Bacillus sp. REN3 TaxID=2802440 RepID=UPI001AEEC285|nr:FkbM family methyltransferase [Bacillus sp. REN3]